MSQSSPAAPPRSRWRRLARWLWRSLLLLVLLASLYFLAVLVGALVPRNSDWVQPKDGIKIWVWSNGVHTDFVVPVKHQVIDWSALVPRGRGPNEDLMLIGWGDRAFYLETPTWGDLKVSTVAKALFWHSGSVMHTSYRTFPPDFGEFRALTLRSAEYQRLVDFVLASFARTDPRPVAIESDLYGASDSFYEAKGSYHVCWTCNNWANQALATAGVKTPLWSPFAAPILSHLPK